MIKRVYVAGALTPKCNWNKNPAIDYLMNVRNMVRVGIELILAGYVPYIPALDFIVFLLLREDEQITEPMIKEYSMSWLEACDAIVLTKGWEVSSGIIPEFNKAKELGIPVFSSVEELKEYEFNPSLRRR